MRVYPNSFVEEIEDMRQAWTKIPTPTYQASNSEIVGIDYRELIIDEPIARLIDAIKRKVASGCKNIHLGIDSPGGACDVQKQLIDTLRKLQENGVQINTYNTRSVQSAAVACFLAAQQRWCNEKSVFMVHNPRDKETEGPNPFADIEQFFKTAFYALRTNVSQRVWDTLCNRETTFLSDQAVHMGVAHGIRNWLDQRFSKMIHIIHPDAKPRWRRDYGFPNDYEPHTDF
jgi:ATP-dependent protease ClpP protease subunit